MGTALVAAFNVVSAYRNAVSVGAIVGLSTSSNWSVGSCAAGTDLTVAGVVKDLAEDRSIATVQLFGYSKAFEADYSGALARGQYPVKATGKTVTGSGTAAASTRRAVCVAVDYPTTGKCQFLAQ